MSQSNTYPAVSSVTFTQKLGSWAAVQKAHFADGALYDQIVARK
ncbi:hypothetical protein [Azonexus hydrophilus]|jgi:sulfate transport system substrate-binding protein|uniref:Sulfate transporter subunit n=1 Tax=Azonexus hydrophilus TaxID=418702 RepID=A0ABZ2XFS2_9RHOO|nr:hypothetical protein [Azonexus hydrophilus]